MDIWDYVLLCALSAVILVYWLPRPTSARSVERRIREYRLHHGIPHRWRRTRQRRSPRLRHRIFRFCGGIIFPGYAPRPPRTQLWAGDFYAGSNSEDQP